MGEDFKSRGQPVYWFATNANVIATLRAVTGGDLKLISGPIELVKHHHSPPPPPVQHNTPPKLKVSKDTDMVTIEEEAPPESASPSTAAAAGEVEEGVNKSPMPEVVPKSFATLFNNS